MELEAELAIRSIFTGSSFCELFSSVNDATSVLNLEVVLLVSFEVVNEDSLNMVGSITLRRDDSGEMLSNRLSLYALLVSFMNTENELFRRLLDLSNHT